MRITTWLAAAGLAIGCAGTGASPDRAPAAAEPGARVQPADTVALDPRRTLTHIRPLVRPGTTMADIRAALGPPDRDVGSGLHIWVYDLHDGTAVIVGDAGRGPLVYAHHVDRAERGPGGLLGESHTLAELPVGAR